MNMHPYLFFDGQCEQAFRYYAEVLGGELGELHRFGEAPPGNEMPGTDPDGVMHMQVKIGDWLLMGSDCPVGSFAPMAGVQLSLNVDSIDEAERVYAALVDGGEIQMPLQETFWAQRFGALVDRFGIAWMVNCDMPTP